MVTSISKSPKVEVGTGDLVTLLAHAFMHPGDMRALDLLSKHLAHPNDLLAAIADARLQSPEIARVIEEEPTWAGRVLAVVAHDAEGDESSVAREAMADADMADELVGTAFGGELLADIPRHLREWNVWLSDIPRVDLKRQQHLARTPSASGAAEQIPSTELHELLSRGLTPLAFVEASNAVWLATCNLRYTEPERFGDRVVVTSARGQKWAKYDVETADVLSHAVCSAADVDEVVGRSLLRWLVAVAHYKPCVFRQFAAEPFEGLGREAAVVLYPDDGTRGWPLPQLWSRTSRPASERVRYPALDRGVNSLLAEAVDDVVDVVSVDQTAAEAASPPQPPRTRSR